MCLKPTSRFAETERCSSSRVWSYPEFSLVEKAEQYLPSLQTFRADQNFSASMELLCQCSISMIVF